YAKENFHIDSRRSETPGSTFTLNASSKAWSPTRGGTRTFVRARADGIDRTYSERLDAGDDVQGRTAPERAANGQIGAQVQRNRKGARAGGCRIAPGAANAGEAAA